MDIGYADKVMGDLMTGVNEGGVLLQKASQVRLDNYGQIKHNSQFANNSGNLKRFRQRLLLTHSVGRAAETENKELE